MPGRQLLTHGDLRGHSILGLGTCSGSGEVDPGARAPILRRYLAVAPGARPHLPVDRRAPLEEFDRIATQIPVFRVTADRPDRATPRIGREL